MGVLSRQKRPPSVLLHVRVEHVCGLDVCIVATSNRHVTSAHKIRREGQKSGTPALGAQMGTSQMILHDDIHTQISQEPASHLGEKAPYRRAYPVILRRMESSAPQTSHDTYAASRDPSEGNGRAKHPVRHPLKRCRMHSTSARTQKHTRVRGQRLS